MKKNKALAPQAAAQMDRDILTESRYQMWLDTLPAMSWQAAKRYCEVQMSNWTPAQRDEVAKRLGMTPENYAKVLAGDYDACFTQWEQDENSYVWEEFKCPAYEVGEIRFKVKEYLAAVERLDAAEGGKKKRAA